MQSAMHLGTRPQIGAYPVEGALFVDFEIDVGEMLTLAIWCENTATWYAMPCVVLCSQAVASSSHLPVTVVHFPSPSTTGMSVTALTARLLRSLRRSLRRSETWQPSVNWAPTLPLDLDPPTDPHS